MKGKHILSFAYVLKDIGVCLKDLSDLFASPFVAVSDFQCIFTWCNGLLFCILPLVKAPVGAGRLY